MNVNESEPASVRARLGLSLFFLVFFAIGMFSELLIIRQFAWAANQRLWKTVPCTIAASEVREGGGESPYAFTVSYRYDYGGQRYTGSVYRRGYSASSKYFAAQNLVQRYPVSQGTVCYVNPKNPFEAVLKRDSPLIGLAALFPLIFVTVGVGGVYFLWRKSPPEEARPIARAARSKKGLGKPATAGICALFAIVGGAMLYPLGIRPIARTIDAKHWAATPCKVLRAEVGSHSGDDSTTYSIDILYEYTFNGRTYKCDRYDFMGGSSSGYEGKARIVEQYESAAQPICYVNPKNPSEAVLKRGFHAKLLLALLPLPFLLIGVGGLLGLLRSKKGGTSVELGLDTREPASTCPHGSSSRPGGGGPAMLKPKFSPRAKLIGAILIAVFWNGIVSLFLSDAGWFSLIFLLPFIAVGLGLIGLVVYQLLALFNPCPALHLSSQTIPLGGAAELRWSFSGRTGRIRELTVMLRGVEQATYRKGTSTCTDTSTFYEMELYRTINSTEIASGQVGFILPHDTMHSFDAQNNKIIWRLDMRGEIDRWPDVKESFEINVAPAA